MENIGNFWSLSTAEAYTQVASSPQGLRAEQVVVRQKQTMPAPYPAFILDIALFLNQFKKPLTLLLLLALVLSAVLGEFTNAVIITVILLLSGIMGFIQERNAGKAVEKLRAFIQAKATVRRDGQVQSIALAQVVEGDLILLKAGDIVSADCLLLESEDLYANEASLTGESFPAEKKVGSLPKDTPLFQRTNTVFKGTNIISGTAIALAMAVGKQTELGQIEKEIGTTTQETAFEQGLRAFGYMLMRAALIMAGVILLINISMGRPAFDSILFALALSLGLTPEMLPAIVTITLASGAKRLAEKKVIVKKLSAIQNFGAIDVLCSDKTGTLTEGDVHIQACIGTDGREYAQLRLYAYLNALFQSGYPNPIDEAIRSQHQLEITGYTKFDEVPYDFIRKRLSIVTAFENRHIMITKGALSNILEVCSHVEHPDHSIRPIQENLEQIQETFNQFSAEGFRILGVCYKEVTDDPIITKDDECDMTFMGYMLFFDPPKKETQALVDALRKQKVHLKIITGDNTRIARHLATQIGISTDRILSGSALHELEEDALMHRINDIDIFSETVPSQKERIVRALQKKGHIVGYLGDGINDAPALKAADVGISVQNAVDVAKESADLILLEKGLGVILDGILEGRKTFLNTLKYIFITISANFGNMFSMAGASIFLPFMPLLPAQILLTNFITDLPALAIASDQVDPEMLQKPRRWDNRLIRNFMIVFGLESSVFDFLTFGVLLWGFHAKADVFRTGWFIETVITEVCILLVIRTRRTFFKSPLGKLLMGASIVVVALALVLPYIPISALLGFTPLPLRLTASMLGIAILYALTGEITKKWLFRKMHY